MSGDKRGKGVEKSVGVVKSLSQRTRYLAVRVQDGSHVIRYNSRGGGNMALQRFLIPQGG